MNARGKLAMILSIVFLLSFLTYAGFEAEKLIYGPQIILNTPKDEDTFKVLEMSPYQVVQRM